MATVAAIDLQGRVVTLLLKPMSIKQGNFVEFLIKLGRRMNKQRTHVVLDNLNAHYGPAVTEKAKFYNLVLHYNPTYSSHLNPIERLWALAKRQFIKDCATDSDFANQAEVEAFVGKCIMTASRETLEKHVYGCLRLMIKELAEATESV